MDLSPIGTVVVHSSGRLGIIENWVEETLESGKFVVQRYKVKFVGIAATVEANVTEFKATKFSVEPQLVQ